MDTQISFRQLLASKAIEYVNVVKAFNFEEFEDLQDLMVALPHIKLRDGYVLDAYYYGDKFAAIMSLYPAKIKSKDQYQPVPDQFLHLFKSHDIYDEAKERMKERLIRPFEDGQFIEGTIPWYASKTVPRIEKYLEFDFTPISIWEVILLMNVTPLYLPHVWHAAYENGKIVVDDETLIEACTSRYVHGVNYESLLGNQRMLLPMVEVKSSCSAIASYCYWNDWQGLSCVTLEITDIGCDIIFDKKEKTLIEYNCKVMF